MRSIEPGMTELTTSSPNAGRDVLLRPGAALCGQRPLVGVALLQTAPIGRDIRPEILGEPDRVGEPKRVADHDVGRRETAGAQRLGLAGRGLDGPEPAEK